MRKRWLAILALVAGCASMDSSESEGESSLSRDMAPGAASDAKGGKPPSQNGGQATAGVLTAGVWDDNRNYEFFSLYRGRLDDKPSLKLPYFDKKAQQDAYSKFVEPSGARETLDIALVIDTTGSMGDEIAYLQKEFTAIAKTIHEQHPGADTRWGLVAYRDKGDAYVHKASDFTGSIEDFQLLLGDLKADGGGDFPEAPDAALAQASKLAWRPGPGTARLLFWVADAPHHVADNEAMVAAVEAARAGDIHIYPVASSGVDELTEYTMRASAQITGGRYLFLTDDSGVGDDHKEPSIPCYFVTKLDKALLRMVDVELSGSYREPQSSEVIRTGGSPESGACKLASGQQVRAF